MSYPAKLAERKAIRKTLIASIMADAERKAQGVGASLKCSGGPSGWAKPLHADVDGGCANDGSTCLCWCHDAREVSGV